CLRAGRLAREAEPDIELWRPLREPDQHSQSSQLRPAACFCLVTWSSELDTASQHGDSGRWRCFLQSLFRVEHLAGKSLQPARHAAVLRQRSAALSLSEECRS